MEAFCRLLKTFWTWPNDTRRHSSPFIACLHYPATLLPKLGTTLCLGPFTNPVTIFPPPNERYPQFWIPFWLPFSFGISSQHTSVASCSYFS
jgi:hypothetical protein